MKRSTSDCPFMSVRKEKENLQDSDILSIFVGVNSIVELKLNYDEKEKTIKCK